jgi:hypothetical protein
VRRRGSLFGGSGRAPRRPRLGGIALRLRGLLSAGSPSSDHRKASLHPDETSVGGGQRFRGLNCEEFFADRQGTGPALRAKHLEGAALVLIPLTELGSGVVRRPNRLSLLVSGADRDHWPPATLQGIVVPLGRSADDDNFSLAGHTAPPGTGAIFRQFHHVCITPRVIIIIHYET